VQESCLPPQSNALATKEGLSMNVLEDVHGDLL